MQALVVAFLLSGKAQCADILITKTQFVDGVKATFPDSFCGDDTYFRKCFVSAKDDCTKSMKTATNSCIEKMQSDFPPNFRQPTDGQSWGEKLGGCIGEKFEIEKSKTRLQTADCKDVNKWGPH